MLQRYPLVISCLIAFGCLHASTAADAQDASNRNDAYVRGRLVQLPATRVAQVEPTERYSYPAPGDSSAPRDSYSISNDSGPVNDGGLVYAEPALPGEQTFRPFAPFGQCDPPWAQPTLLSGISVFGEFLFLHPRDANVPYAVAQDGILFPGTTPMGPVAVANLGYQPGFRVGAASKIGADAQASASYTWFESSTSDSLTAVAPLVINPLAMFPGTFNAGFTAQQATASYDVNFQFIDADYEGMMICCDRHWLGYLVGASYGNLEQDFSVSYPFAPPDGTTSVSTTVNFDGAGPHVGLEGERRIFPLAGLSVYGRGVARFLVGRFRANYTQVNQFNGVEVDTSLDVDRIVPVLDLEVGLAWLGPGGHLRLSAGYLVSAWFNTLTTPDWIQTVQASDFNAPSGNLTFDGLVARAEWRF